MSNNPKFDELLQKMQTIHQKKEADYTGDKDPHFNFRFSADFAANFENRIDKPYAYLIGTKIARLISLLEKDNVVPQNEPLEDTFVDLANYFLLWASRRIESTEKKSKKLSNQTYTCAKCGLCYRTEVQRVMCPHTCPICGASLIGKPRGCPNHGIYNPILAGIAKSEILTSPAIPSNLEEPDVSDDEF